MRSVVLVLSAAIALCGIGTASAVEKPGSPQDQFGNAIGDTGLCYLDYRLWAETDPARPGRIAVHVQPLGVQGGATGSSAECKQWVTVRWSRATDNLLDGVRIGEHNVFLRATGAPGEVISLDLATGPGVVGISAFVPGLVGITGWNGGHPPMIMHDVP
ncbi:hypothetical protein AB0H76_06995 [Nocardia sp. NPDC050712]|uniref:hypothetical protein n=1 Tax=Nocardia sp. NPDC050712 TaxID=3155518 RepID=UPI00340BCA0E